jgi:serine O-acetyltransferase
MSITEIVKLDFERAAGEKYTFGGLIRQYIKDIGFRVVFRYRIANYLKTKKIKYLPTMISNRNLCKAGAEILPTAQIGPGLLIVHPVGIVIGSRCIIGRNCTILQGVTLGESCSTDGVHEYPVLEDNVLVCSGVKVIGRVTVRENCIVGANSVVLKDVPANSVVAGIPAKVVGRVVGKHL